MAAVYFLRACIQGKLDVKASIYVSFEAKMYTRSVYFRGHGLEVHGAREQWVLRVSRLKVNGP